MAAFYLVPQKTGPRGPVCTCWTKSLAGRVKTFVKLKLERFFLLRFRFRLTRMAVKWMAMAPFAGTGFPLISIRSAVFSSLNYPSERYCSRSWSDKNHFYFIGSRQLVPVRSVNIGISCIFLTDFTGKKQFPSCCSPSASRWPCVRLIFSLSRERAIGRNRFRTLHCGTAAPTSHKFFWPATSQVSSENFNGAAGSQACNIVTSYVSSRAKGTWLYDLNISFVSFASLVQSVNVIGSRLRPPVYELIKRGPTVCCWHRREWIFKVPLLVFVWQNVTGPDEKREIFAAVANFCAAQKWNYWNNFLRWLTMDAPLGLYSICFHHRPLESRRRLCIPSILLKSFCVSVCKSAPHYQKRRTYLVIYCVDRPPGTTRTTLSKVFSVQLDPAERLAGIGASQWSGKEPRCCGVSGRTRFQIVSFPKANC